VARNPIDKPDASALRTQDDVVRRIFELRGQRVMLDADLARLYGVPTKILNQAVSRNLQRFPPDFMFRLTPAEAASLKSQIVTSNRGRGGRRRSTPRAFTEQGVAMLSGVLRSRGAIAVNVEIMRAFARLRRLYGEHAELTMRIDELEAKFDESFRIVFAAIRAMQTPAITPRRPLGFRPRRR
jgi:hypothetical protein